MATVDYSRELIVANATTVEVINAIKDCTNVSLVSTTVRSAKFDEEVEFAVLLSTAKRLPQMVTEHGVTVEGSTRSIRSNNSALTSILRDGDDSDIADILEKNPQLLPVIFNGATIDVIGIKFAAGELVDNPFSAHAPSERNVIKNDYIKYYVYGVELHCPQLDAIRTKFNQVMLDSISIGD
jgi:hypothetical protein